VSSLLGALAKVPRLDLVDLAGQLSRDVSGDGWGGHDMESGEVRVMLDRETSGDVEPRGADCIGADVD
jgi:hypothetical protein